MQSEPEDIERIEAYVERRLSEADHRLFEERLANEPGLVRGLQAYRITRKALVDVFAEEQARGKRSRYRWAAAAAVLVLLGTGWWYLRNDAPSLPELAERSSVEEAPLPVLMAGPLQHRSDLDRSMQLFGAERYDPALEELSRLHPSDTVAFYTGLCLIATERDPSSALLQVIEDGPGRYRPKALYHLMLWHMRNNDRAQAKRLFQVQESIADHPYREQLDAIARTKVLVDRP